MSSALSLIAITHCLKQVTLENEPVRGLPLSRMSGTIIDAVVGLDLSSFVDLVAPWGKSGNGYACLVEYPCDQLDTLRKKNSLIDHEGLLECPVVVMPAYSYERYSSAIHPHSIFRIPLGIGGAGQSQVQPQAQTVQPQANFFLTLHEGSLEGTMLYDTVLRLSTGMRSCKEQFPLPLLFPMVRADHMNPLRAHLDFMTGHPVSSLPGQNKIRHATQEISLALDEMGLKASIQPKQVIGDGSTPPPGSPFFPVFSVLGRFLCWVVGGGDLALVAHITEEHWGDPKPSRPFGLRKIQATQDAMGNLSVQLPSSS